MSKLTVDYKGLVVSTCAIEPSNPEHGDEVTFKQSSTGGKAVFLMKVKEYDNSGDFKAKYVSPERAARHVELFPKLNRTNKDTSPLFVVHGFNTQPAEHMTGVATKWPRFTDAGLNYYPIPVIWPCNDSNFIVRYSRDQEDPSQRAGKELTALVDAIPNDLFPRKSLLMHSMGNHVVFNGACGMKDQTGKVVDKAPDVEFDNIFLAAADVPHDIFWENPWDYDNKWVDKARMKRLYGQKKQKATNMFRMLKVDESGKPIGKIYVLHYRWDKALMASSTPFVNNETRIGSVGHMKDGANKVRADMRDYIEDYDMYSYISWCNGDSNALKHSYQLEPAAIKFYFSKDIGYPEVV